MLFPQVHLHVVTLKQVKLSLHLLQVPTANVGLVLHADAIVDVAEVVLLLLRYMAQATVNLDVHLPDGRLKVSLCGDRGHRTKQSDGSYKAEINQMTQFKNDIIKSTNLKDIDEPDKFFSMLLEKEAAREIDNIISVNKLADAYKRGDRHLEFEYPCLPKRGFPTWLKWEIKLYHSLESGHIESFHYVYDVDRKSVV